MDSDGFLEASDGLASVRHDGDEMAPADRRRWSIALLLGLGVLVNYFDRVNLTVSHDALVSEFRISDVTFGLLLGAYNWTYALCQLPSGVLLDRFGVRRVGCVSTLLWSIASFAAAITKSMAGFFGARFLLGDWRGADISGKCQGYRALVSTARAKPGDELL